MLSSLRCIRGPTSWAFGSSAMSLAHHQQIREMRLFEIFSKEKREARRKKLHDDMNRGYFDDFKDFRDNKGKIFYSPEKLIPASQAHAFPAITPLTSDGTPFTFPPTGPSAPVASLVSIAFRAGAQQMIESWAAPFSHAHSNAPNVALYELSVVESIVMRVWPFRSMLMASGGKSQALYAMPCTYLYYLKDYAALRAALHMSNILTGYVYLIDSEGRVRWSGSGHPEASEIESMLRCTQQLLDTQ